MTLETKFPRGSFKVYFQFSVKFNENIKIISLFGIFQENSSQCPTHVTSKISWQNKTNDIQSKESINIHHQNV